MKFLAPAKINLYLEIVGERPNGYHELESVMHTVDLCDELEFLSSNKLELVCDNAVCAPEKNLVYKVAKKLKEQFNVKDGIKIILNKKIPTGAGLGGGSSDAATTLVALNKIWNLNLDKNELKKIAGTIGSDVAFFLEAPMANVEGIGDIVTKINSNNKYSFILVKPNFGVSTVEAYSKIKMPLTNTQKNTKILSVLENACLTKELAKELLYNRFEETVFLDYPEIKKIKTVLESLGAVALMSGSGATVFGLVSDKQEAKKILEALKIYDWNVWSVNSFDIQY